jgi:hypothetical protein
MAQLAWVKPQEEALPGDVVELVMRKQLGE